MSPRQFSPRAQSLADALGAGDSSARLSAAMAAGSPPEASLVKVVIMRCGIEPDFFVRDMLTWALVQLPAELTLPRLKPELESRNPQARSQALHSLSKIAEPSTWPWTTQDMLRDPFGTHPAPWRTRPAPAGRAGAGPDAPVLPPATLVRALVGESDAPVAGALGWALARLGPAAIEPLSEAAREADPTVRRRAVLTISKFPADATLGAHHRPDRQRPGGAAACGHDPVRAGHRCRHPGAVGSGGGW